MISRLPFPATLFLFLAFTGTATAQVEFTRFVIDSIFATNSRPYDVKAADFNGDEEIDIVVTSPDYFTVTNDIFLLYQNDGDENFTEITLDSTVDSPRRMDVADLDGDLDNDIVLAYEAGLSWYENDGNGNFSNRLIDALIGITIPFVLDFDGDFDLDIPFMSSYGVFWDNNDGNQLFTRDTVQAIPTSDHALAVSDLDGDLDNDVITTITENGDHYLIWYQNDGSESFSRDTIDVWQQSILNPFVDDLDEDGDNDIIHILWEGNTIVWYENDGNENFTADTVGVDFDEAPNSISIGDIDNDNDRDVIVVGGNHANGEVVYYENDGNENFTKQVIDNGEGNRNRLFIVDIDGDDDLDIFVTNNFPSEVLFYRNDGPSTGIGNESSPGIPGGFTLTQNYPNPFNPSTTIRYTIPEATGIAAVNISIFDLRGRRIRRLVDEEKRPGSYQVHWDGTDDSGQRLGSGVYLYTIEAGPHESRRKMTLVR